VRRTCLTVAVAVAFAGALTARVSAQDARIRTPHTIVIPQELIVELQKLARDAFGEDAVRDLGREIGQAMRDLSRELGHFSSLQPGVHVLPQNTRDFRAEQTDRQTRTLAIGATGSLELKNVVGDISIKTGGREVTVEIVRISRGRTDADAKAGLERVNAAVTARGDRGSVIVEYPNERMPNYSVSVAFNVTAPAGTSLEVQSVTGDVTITGIRGDIDANTVSGDLHISQAGRVGEVRTVSGALRLTDIQTDNALEASTMSGAVTLENIRARRLDVSAVSAEIVARGIQAGGADITCMSGEIDYSGTVAPKGRYEFQAHSGEIRLALTGGFEFEGRSFSGQIEADPSFGLKPNREPASTTRIRILRQASLTGTVGGGGAFVEATTFSGQIRLLRGK
jgi:hypothetical protein